MNYGVFLLVFWFFSRFFNDNYVSYLSLIFLAAYLVEEKTPNEEEKMEESSVFNINKVKPWKDIFPLSVKKNGNFY